MYMYKSSYQIIYSLWDYDIIERDDVKSRNYSTFISYTVCSLYINTIPEKSRNQLICSFVFLINIFQSD